MNENKKKCAELSHAVMAEMISDGYSAKSVEHHNKYIFDFITEFCSEKYEGYYSVGAGKVFLESVYQRHLSKPQEKVYLHTVERLNHALEGDTHWHPDNHQCKDYTSSSYDPIVRDYENYLYQTGKTTTNVRHHIHSISRFLCHMDSLGIFCLSDITSEHIYERFVNSNDKAGFHKTLKMFFRYAHKYGLIGKELTHCIPSVTRHTPVPTVYSSDEINKILNSIDRNSCTGKRDYCIVLMASKLGIRSCDIAALQLNDIHKKEGILHIKQQKTNIPIDLPILPEISIALNDYLSNARPESNLPHVFLTCLRPSATAISTQGIYGIVSRAIKRSEINTQARRKGAHALRSSLASRLLTEGKTYSEIQQVLGQTSPDVARHYIRIEVERLRECSIEIPLLSDELTACFLERQVD